MEFTNLHLHTDIGSCLDGMSTVEEVFKRASELGQSAISVSDHASTAALPYMIKYGKKYNVKPILACEFYIVDDINDPLFGKRGENRMHFLATAKNWNGCKSIFKKLTIANRQYFNGRPRLFLSQLFDFEDCFISLACAISLLAKDNWREVGEKFHNTYKGNFYLELINASFKMKDSRQKKEIEQEPREMPDQGKLVNLRCIELHKEFGITLCATVDSHFTYPEHAKAFETLLAIQTRSKMTEKTYDQGGKRFFFGDNNIYIKDGEEVFNDLVSLGYIDEDIIISSIENTNFIADNCCIDMPKFNLNLPKPYEGDDYLIFKEKVEKGFYKLGLDKKPNAKEYLDRIEYEIDAIEKVGFIRYFLIMTDIMDYCRDNNIATGSCRGSCGASIVLLCLGVIRRIDAIEHDLIFSRFINTERISFPDVDTDFSSKDRYKIVKYIEEKYGKGNVCGISTYTYLSAKNAFRDVCSSNSFPSKEVNRLSKLIEEGVIKEDGKIVGSYSRIESFDHVPELKDFKKIHKDLFNVIKILDGRVRGAGVHAAAIICSSVSLHDLGPVMFRKGGYCIAYDKKTSEDMFCMLKIDALGLKTIDITNTACNLISKKTGRMFTTDDIPLDDKKTKKMVSDGDTIGVFQFGGLNARRTLKECKDGSLEAQAGISSAIRPGVIAAKDENGVSATTHYTNKLNGSEDESYYIEEFRDILSDTKGELLFQEQVMRTCSLVAGFSESEADNMRRLIGKKCTKEEFEEVREKFVSGCTIHSNIPIEKSNHIFDNFVKSSSYLFNKCLTGDTEIIIGNTYEKISIKDFYENWGANNCEKLILQMDPDKVCRPKEVKNVFKNGLKEVYKITTKSGHHIKATNNHKFLTQDGYKRTDKIITGKDYFYSFDYKNKVKGAKPSVDLVVSIEYSGIEMTFDLEMNTKDHNFCANGIVTHNSHATGYAILSMESAYLKKHHPVEFYCSLLSYTEENDQLSEYITDAKRHNVDILYPDINKSSASEFTIHDKKILAPLNAIKGVGNVAADFIIQARPKDGFKSYDDFLNVLTEKKLNGKINVRVKNILYRANAFKSLDYYVQDKQERRNNLRELLSLFSPMPSINFKTGRGVDKVAYQELITTAKKCSQRARNGNFVNPVGGVRPSIFVVMDISKSNTVLFETPYTNWFPEHLRIRLDVPKGALYFSNALKCSHYNVEKKDIPGTCWTLCTREFLKREIEIIQPRLVINTVSKVCPWISGVKGLRFQESLGKIYFSAITDSYVINVPSPQWIKYSEEIRDTYKAEIIPLLEGLNKDQK